MVLYVATNLVVFFLRLHVTLMDLCRGELWRNSDQRLSKERKPSVTLVELQATQDSNRQLETNLIHPVN